MLTSALTQKMMNIICHDAGPLILQTFCSAKDETFSVGDNLTCKLNPNFGVDEGKAMRKLTAEKCCEEARKLGRIRRQVLQGLVACLHYSGNSLQVILCYVRRYGQKNLQLRGLPVWQSSITAIFCRASSFNTPFRDHLLCVDGMAVSFCFSRILSSIFSWTSSAS
jgi:hypothetical protein